MSNLASNVAYQELLRLMEAGKIAQSQAIISPSKYQCEILESIARILVGSYRPSHPDILIIGSVEKPPSVENCRWLIENIALKPLEGKKRLAVIMNGDKLNKSAGNSLLKLTEEPPPYANILFLMEDARIFLPTLRSRVHCTAITMAEKIEPQRMPQDPQEWLDWLTKARKSTSEDDTLTADITSWEENECMNGNIDMSLTLEKLRNISRQKNISVPMLCDLILLTIMDGGNENEDILNDIWEA